MFLLKEVDDSDHVIEKREAGVHSALLASCAAHDLAFPAGPEKVHWPTVRHEIGQEEGADEGHCLGQIFVEGLDG